MLVSIITEKNAKGILEKVKNSSTKVDIYELRLDYLNNIDFDQLQAMRKQINKPLIFSLRSKSEKGYFDGSERDRLKLITSMCRLEPEYLDIEDYVNDNFVTEIHGNHPNIKIIRSYHNFLDNPRNLNLDDILSAMQHSCVTIYKLCVMADKSVDNLHILNFIRQNSANYTIIAHCMGEQGTPSRILGAIFGSCFTYSIETNIHDNNKENQNNDAPAPGLLDIPSLTGIYNIQNLNAETKIYALLGDPVSHSVGHLFHNENFKRNNINAVYVKLLMTSLDLQEFFTVLKKYRFLNFAGFSITMPLKNDIITFLDDIDYQAIDAVNTVKVEGGNLIGINTDGDGALNAVIQNSNSNLNDKSVMILGAGGAATAIAVSFANAGCKVTILNRTIEKAKLLAQKCKGHYIEFDSIPNCKYDIIFNTLPDIVTNNNESLLDIIYGLVHKDSIFMDINYSKPIVINNIKNIAGKEMFIEQAKLQFKYWCK